MWRQFIPKDVPPSKPKIKEQLTLPQISIGTKHVRKQRQSRKRKIQDKQIRNLLKSHTSNSEPTAPSSHHYNTRKSDRGRSQQVPHPKLEDEGTYDFGSETAEARTVLVKNNDIDVGYRVLDRILRNDKILEIARRKRFYEKPFQERRRVSYERCKRIYNSEMHRKIEFVMRKNRTDAWPR
ncbi:hypothetical protein ScPMuIL_016351 [Solemya velum]